MKIELFPSLNEQLPIWKTPLRVFLGGAAILPDAPLDSTWSALIEVTKAEIIAAVGRAQLAVLPYKSPDHQSAIFYIDASRDTRLRTMVIMSEACLIGGVAGGTTWIEEGMRGTGLGAEMVIAAHSCSPYRFLAPTAYSSAGFKARLRAHRLATERALIAGEAVPSSVLNDYEVGAEGRLRLRNPGAWL